MRQSVQLIALLCGSLMLASAQAAPVKMLGFDDMSCAAWNASKGDDEQRAVYLTWMFVNTYCGSNPKGEFSDAVFRLSDQFSGRNQPIKK